VFLGALAVGHPWFGVLLVVAFGAGMATTLAAVGVAVMRVREQVERRLAGRPGGPAATVLAALPTLTAAGVTVLGALLAVRGIGQLRG
jgi:ABC-type nickel/cobalt efflux system permease component RcnA